MNRPLGYTIAVIGLAGFAATVIKEVNTFFQDTLKIPINQIDSTTLTIISLVIVAIGIFLVVKSKPKYSHKNMKGKELPIYHGKEIVGYRRH